MSLDHNSGMTDESLSEGKHAERTYRTSWGGSWASLRDLEVLRAVIDQGGITAAAKHLGVSQPAVSRTISLLEDRSGRTFFTKDGTQAVPTAEALQLYEASGKIFESLEILQDFRWLEARDAQIIIATAPTLANYWLPGVVLAFREKYPATRVSITIHSSMDVIAAVANGDAEVGIAEVPNGDWGVQVRTFRRSRLVVAMQRSHPLAKKQSVGAEDFADEPMVALLKRNPLRAVLDRVLWRSGSLPNIVIETSDSATALDYVAAGQGVAVVNPFPVVLENRHDLAFVPLDPLLEYETSIFTAAKTPMSSATRRFIDLILATQPPSSAITSAI
jgi:DNA-binding transcriptional LysR family regulator